MKFVIAISRLVGKMVEVRGIGYAEADSMEKLVETLDVGELVRTFLQPSHTSIYFTEAGQISTPQELRDRILKIGAELMDSEASKRYATIEQAATKLWIAAQEAVGARARIEARVNRRNSIGAILEQNGVSVTRVADADPQFHVDPYGYISIGAELTLEKFMAAVAKAMT